MLTLSSMYMGTTPRALLALVYMLHGVSLSFIPYLCPEHRVSKVVSRPTPAWSLRWSWGSLSWARRERRRPNSNSNGKDTCIYSKLFTVQNCAVKTPPTSPYFIHVRAHMVTYCVVYNTLYHCTCIWPLWSMSCIYMNMTCADWLFNGTLYVV